jgi:hypothetical protein
VAAVDGMTRSRRAPVRTHRKLRQALRLLEVIGSALLAAADGVGHRTIAARLDRPPGTVRGWLRAASRHADALTRCGVRWATTLSEPPARSSPWSSPLHPTVDALASAALAWKLRVGDLTNPPWKVAAALTGGGLLNGRPRDPPMWLKTPLRGSSGRDAAP